MLQRTSAVDKINIDTISFSSIFEIGDSTYIQGFSRAIAVQREAEFFNAREGNYSVYPIFSESIPLLPIEEEISIQTTQLNPVIKVQNIDVIGVSSSSIIHIGSSKHISMETRVKHIRQLYPKRNNQTGRA
ncbi:spore germination protein GerPE [Cytobacillus oceanisediminis]|uniref:spore germination protein GerPE n=1 Tax=Cytobacillus oceanisediminis TaxID=665099 RepID=UPI003736CE2D